MSDAATGVLNGSDGGGGQQGDSGQQSGDGGGQSTVPGGDNGQQSTVPGGNDNGGQQQSQNSGGDGSSPWYGDIEDAELKGWVENKGFKDPVAALQSMKNQEKLLGSDKIAMPKDMEDKEGWDKVYDKLGRPKESADYQLPVPEGEDGEFAKVAGDWMHEAGLNTTQARALAEKWNEYASKAVGEQEAAQAVKFEQELEGLKKEWGNEYATNVNAADQVNREFDIPKADLDAILAGSEATLVKTLHKISKGMLEDNYKDGDNGKRFGQTKEGARAEIQEKRADKDFMEKYNKGDPVAINQMNELYKKAEA